MRRVQANVAGTKCSYSTFLTFNTIISELKACQPNPCKNEGVCRLKPTSGYECNCANTGYEGDNCEIGVVTMPAYPPLGYGKSSGWIEIRAKPGKELIITPQAVNGDILFTPKRVQLRFVLFLKFKVFCIKLKSKFSIRRGI